MSAIADFPEFTPQTIPAGYLSAHHLMPFRYDGDKYGKCSHDLIAKLAFQYGVKAIVQYYPLYRYSLFQRMGFGEANCPNTDHYFDNMVSLPFHLWMSEQDFDYMIESTRSALKELRDAR